MDTFLQSLNPLMMPLYLQITSGVMAFLLLNFVIFFLGIGSVLWWRLHRLLARLHKDKGDVDPGGIGPIFSRYKKFNHLWSEYAETLHRQRPQAAQTGHGELAVCWRATEPAEVYFSAEVVVDSSVGAEFFRHLPGIFTGIGIIGTFMGLIMGLSGFHPSNDPAETLKMIGPLIDSVHEAFLVSAVAITLAMVVTIVEKLCITRWHALTEKLAHELDSRFDAGVGEEYLARLTESSEKAASQASMLKDQMVEQMGELLREISKEQTQAINSSQQALASNLTESIEKSLSQPLERMEQTFKTVTGGTGERTVEMLGDVMADFSERLKNLFGGQIENINELNRKSAEAMQSAATSMGQLVEKLSAQSAQATERMSDSMAQAIQDMEQRQKNINDQTQSTLKDVAGTMQDMLDAMHESHEQQQKVGEQRQLRWADKTATIVEGLSAQSAQATERMSDSMAQAIQDMEQRQKSINNQTQTTLKDVAGTMQAMLDAMHESHEQRQQVSEQRQQQWADKTSAMVEGLGTQVDGAAEQMTAASAIMADAVDKLAEVTTSSIEKMDAGAEKMVRAADGMGGVGEKLGSVLDKAAETSRELGTHMHQLLVGMRAVEAVMEDYQRQRQAMQGMMEEARVMIDGARKEASMTETVLQRIDQSSHKLAEVHEDFESYLGGVNDVLERSSKAFGDSVTQTLGEVNQQFHQDLSRAVKLLSASIDQLDTSLANMSGVS